MSWLRRIFGRPRPPTCSASEAGGTGTVESVHEGWAQVLLDSGRVVRVTLEDSSRLDLRPSKRVAITELQVSEGATWARGVELTDKKMAKRIIPELSQPAPPQRELSPREIERNRRAAAERMAQITVANLRRRRNFLQEAEQKAERPASKLEKLLGDGADGRRLLAPCEVFAKHQMPALRLVSLPGGNSSVQVASHFGGRPHLPPTEGWPAGEHGPLSLIAELDLAELASKGRPLEDLPQSGLLLFFYDALEQPWGFNPEDGRGWKVLYNPSPSHAPAPWPDQLAEAGRFPHCDLHAVPVASYPSAFARQSEDLVATDLDEDDQDAARDALWELFNDLHQAEQLIPQHALGGWPEIIQDEMESQCQLVSQGVRMGNEQEYNETFREGMEQGAEEWLLLLQVDSDETGTDWMWGDLGKLYFWIRRQDLQAHDFSKVWVLLQCT